MNQFFVAVLVLVSAALGCIVGETYAPISGKTVYALTLRVEVLETRLEEIDTRCKKLEASMKDWATRIRSGLPDKL